MKFIPRLLLVLPLWLGLAPFAAAQAAPFPHHLLALLPDDFAVCVVMHDLHGNAGRWQQADWLKKLRASPLGKAYLQSPESKSFERVQDELKKHLDLDWPTLRDDILGDTLILCHTPGAKNKPNDEHGLILLQVRKPARLVHLIDKLNAAQIKAGKLEVTSFEHNGVAYYRRDEGPKTQFYMVKDSLAAVASNESVMKAFLDRRANPPRDNPWKERFERAGADAAFLTLCVNPRLLDAEILKNSKKNNPLPGYWRALDAIFVTASIKEEAVVRLSIQANVDRLPDWAKGAFTQTTPASSLWQRFPEKSTLTIASKTDFSGLADALKLVMPEKDRNKLDPFKDLLPNIGPDWGVCVLPSKDANHLPPALFALALKPGPKGRPTDQALLLGLEFLVRQAVQKHNETNPGATIRVMDDKVGIKYLAGDKLFPPGLQPAWTLKDGFLLVATSPEAIAAFRLHDKQIGGPKDAPMMRLSAPELAKLLEHRRGHILATLNDKDAKKNLDNLIALLSLFDRLTFSQHGEAGQATWTIRLTPAK